MIETTYSPLQKILHWLTVLLLALQWWSSGAVLRTHERHPLGHRPSAYDLFVHELHIYGGLGLLALTFGRLLLRWKRGPARLPATVPPWERGLAHVAHLLLYAALIGLTLTGMIATYFWFGMSVAHRWLVYLLYALVTAHVLAVIGNDVWRGAGLVRRMAFSRRPE